MSELIDRLRDWDAGIRGLAEQAEARIAVADALVRDLHGAGRIKSWVLLGDVMSVRPYDPGYGPEDSGQVTQAILVVPDGLGVAFWDTEEYRLFSPGQAQWREARWRFTPIANCPPLTRVQFLPYAADLVARLVHLANRR